jgi:hypothetical protein
MRRLIFLACASVASVALLGATLVGTSRGADAGMLSVERGRGSIVLDVRGTSVLGRLGNGTITVLDRSPSDPYVANVTGRRVVQKRLGPSRVLFRGQGLRYRMVGGDYRIVVRGTGITLSAVGKGSVWLDGEPRFEGDDTGIYSVEGVDCSLEAELCTAIPDEPLRLRLGPSSEKDPVKPGVGSR